MRILLVNSHTSEAPLAEQLHDFYTTIPGEWQFELGEKELVEDVVFNEREKVSWDIFFNRLDHYRTKHNVSPDTFILLLTNERNELNWFGSFDIRDKPQGFVQISYWDELVSSESIYPILYEVVAIPLQWRLFRNVTTLEGSVHEEPIGCINDFCENKREIILKLQTGNICSACFEKMRLQGFTDQEFDHIDEILDRIRLNFRLFNIQRNRRIPYTLRLVHSRQIYIGDHELQLSPIQKALYLFFLNNDDDVRTDDLVDYENEIIAVYGKFYTGSEVKEMIQIAGRLARNEDGLATQTVSRINAKIDRLVIPELAEHYKIITDNEGYKTIKALIE